MRGRLAQDRASGRVAALFLTDGVLVTPGHTTTGSGESAMSHIRLLSATSMWKRMEHEA